MWNGERWERERVDKERNEENKLILKKKENDDLTHKTPTLVIATNNFEGGNYSQLDIKKDEFLIVTNWNCGEKGWVYGHRKDNEKEKGFFQEKR